MIMPSPDNPVLSEQPHRDVLEAALMYLMTRYTLKPCTGLARGVVHHLHLLLSHPDLEASPVDRSAYESLLRDWGLIAFDASCPAKARDGANAGLH